MTVSTNKFVKVDHIGDSLLNTEIESNLKTYLDWGLLSIGGWQNIDIPTSGAYGGSFDVLRPVADPSYEDGQVWEAARKDWVWETGMEYSGITSTGTTIAVETNQLTGVVVNGTGYGTGDITYSHHYNYHLGRVVFDDPINITDTVQLEYSSRNVQVYIADQAPWWDEIQQESYRVDDSTYDQAGSGNWSILSNHRVQLPAVIIEAVPRRSFNNYQMGDISQFVYQDVLFHVLASNRWWRNQLVDIISLQKDSQIWLYDPDKVGRSGDYPLDYRGMLVNSDGVYPNLVDKHKTRLCRFYNVLTTEMRTVTSNLYAGTVRVTFEMVYH